MGKAARRKQDAPSQRDVAVPRRAPAAPRATPGWLPALVGPACIVVLGWLLYANSFAVPFLFDDFFEIESNPTVKELAPLTSYFTRSRGFTALTFALNVRNGGMDVWGFHFVNVVIHVANALLVYALVLFTLRLPLFEGRYRARARILAALVALIFVAHPLQTMATSYIVQRAESLGSFFYLSTVLCAAVALTSDGRRRTVFGGVALLAILLGVISKEIVATVPAAVALYWFCFLRGAGAGLRRRWWVAAALLLLPIALSVLLARDYLMPAAPDASSGQPKSWMFIPTAGFSVEGIGPWQYLITQFGVIVWYLRLFLLPAGQVFDYGWPFADSVWRADVLLPLALLLAILGAAVLAYRRYVLAAFCLGWMFITLAPTSSLVPLRDAAFEHRMYLPIVGLAWLLIVGGADLLAAVAARIGQTPRALWRAGAVAAAVWIAVLGVATVQRNAVFADAYRFAEDNVQKTPANWRAQYNWGDALMKRGRDQEAIAAYEESIRLNPNQGSGRVSLGAVYVQRKQYDDAERVLEPATRHPEESVVAAAQQNISGVYLARGDLARAEQAMVRALQLKPGWTVVRRHLASVYARREDWIGAAREYNEVLHANPRMMSQVAKPAAIANFRAGVLFTADGQYPVAKNLFGNALKYDPSLWRARCYLAYASVLDADWARAEQELKQVLREHPGDPWSAEALQRVGKLEQLVPPPTS